MIGAVVAQADGSAVVARPGAEIGPRARRALSRHGLFLLVLVLAIVPRVVASLAVQPAMWVLLDAIGYIVDTLHLQPDTWRPSGYSLLMLWPLLPAHSLALVIALQHAMGIGVGVLTYVVLLRLGLPSWAAALGTVPVLFDGYLISLEQTLASDPLFITLVTVAVLLLLWRTRRPAHLVVAAAGLLLGLSVITRVAGLPLIGVGLLFFLLPRPAWSRLAVLCVTFALPVAGYALWFSHTFGQPNLTATGGIFLYAHTTRFVDCNRTHYSNPSLRRLCPVGTHDEAWYIFNPASPIGTAHIPLLVANSLAQQFAVQAIETQPRDFAALAWDGAVSSFGWDQSHVINDMRFRHATLPAAAHTAGIAYQQSDPGPFERPDLISAMATYQWVAHVPAPAFPLAFLVAMAALVFGRDPDGRGLRRALLLMVGIAAALLLVPAMTTLPATRYRVPGVPELGPVLVISGYLLANRWIVGRRARTRTDAAAHPSQEAAQPQPQAPAPEPVSVTTA